MAFKFPKKFGTAKVGEAIKRLKDLSAEPEPKVNLSALAQNLFERKAQHETEKQG